jgi:RNA polymerase sigma-70 factor (ECF subfamily)
MRVDASDSVETLQLLERVRAGEAGAADQLFALHRPALSRFAELRLDRKLRQRVDPSDVVQEAQLEAYRRLPDYLARPEPRMPFRLWVRRIAYDRLLMLRRRHVEAETRAVDHEVKMSDQSSLPPGQQLAAPDSTPSNKVIRREIAEQLCQALDQLPEIDREILIMRFFEGLSNQETAQALEISPSAASRRYGRALIKLQKLLPTTDLPESKQ